jgi:glycosyltransferase involved in cell wall biosynthesis/SAM-dependent methyltransferase
MMPEDTASTQSYFENTEIWENALLPYQIQVQRDILRVLPEGITSILDVGCGNGVITNVLPESIRVMGVDLSQAALKQVRRETRVGCITALPFEENSFDLVMANDLLEHLTAEQLEVGIQELKRVSRRYILLTVPFLEDLNAGSLRCGNCEKFYHVNHHRQAFDVAKLQQLLVSRQVRCLKTILSGARWQGIPPEVMLLKRILGVDGFEGGRWVCSHCGTPHEAVSVPAEHPRLSQFLAHLTSELFLHNPNLRDVCQTPTEVICLFEQSVLPFAKDGPSQGPAKLSKKLYKPWAYTDRLGNPVELEQARLSSRYLDFREPERYQQGFLPLTGFLPYFLSNPVEADGIRISDEASVLVGFFARQANSGRPVKMRLKGWALPNTVLTLESYDDVFAYHSPLQVTVSGKFSLRIALPEATRSKYGMLFKISADQSSLLNRAKLYNVTGTRLRAYDFSEEKAVFLQLEQSISVFLGLSPEAKPHEMFHTSWMEQPSLLRLNHFPELQQVDPLYAVKLLRQVLEKLSVRLVEQYGFDSQLAAQMVQVTLAMRDISDTDLMTRVSSRLEEQLGQFYTSRMAQGYQSVASSSGNVALLKRFKVFLRQISTPGSFQTNARQIFRRQWGGKSESFEQYKTRLVSTCTPELFDYRDGMEPPGIRRFLMICHDQRIDRRILQQAQALQEQGWAGRIVCLSFDNEDAINTYEGVLLHRIGKKRLVPMPCEVYWRYQKRQYHIQKWGRATRLLHKLNWKRYKNQLRKTYRCQNIQYPLPFDLPFYHAGVLYPSDLVIAHDLTALKAAHQLSRQWQVPLIYDSHELYSEQVVFSDFQKQIMDATEQQYAPDCAAVITVSQSIARKMAEKNNIPEPAVILNVTDPQWDLSPTRTRVLHDLLGIPYGHKIILFQGGIIPRRNLDILVRGFRRLELPEVHLVMLGPAKPEFLVLLKKLARALCDRQIHFLPAVNQQELLYYTTSADFGVIPYPPIDLNTKFCMPNKTFEYIQACLPILANDLVEIGRFIEELEGGGMVADLNSDVSMANALQAMLCRDLDQDRQRLAMIKERYTWQVEKQHYLDIVEKIMVPVKPG